VGHRGLGQIEHRVDVDLKGCLPFIVADVADVLEGGLMRCIVDEDIDAVQLLDGSLDDRPAMFGVAECPSPITSMSIEPANATPPAFKWAVVAAIRGPRQGRPV
jgi:hypothetical protein